MVLNKPAGLLAVKGRWNKEEPNVIELVQRAITKGEPSALERGWKYVGNPHRIDRNTSGTILLAKSPEVLRRLMNLFRKREIKKTYLALVKGSFPGNIEELEHRIRKNERPPYNAMIVKHRGALARSKVSVKERFRAHTLLLVETLTGRYHQVRAQLAAEGYPLIGDSMYGGKPLYLSEFKKKYKEKQRQRERPLMPRQALHADSLAFTWNDELIRVEAPLPKDFQVSLKQLRKYGS